jgi:uncharacterized membrane protein YgcG
MVGRVGRWRESRRVKVGRVASVVVAAGAFLGSKAQAATHAASSCSVADIQAAVASAGDGDTVLVPGGSCTWTTALTVSKGITLNGQGATVTFGSGSRLNVNTDAVASAVVTRFKFNNGFTGGQYPIAVTTTSEPFNVAFRIYDNTLDDDGSQGSAVTFIGVTGFGPGLIDHDTFTTSAGGDEVIHLLGSGNPTETFGWSNDVVPGGPNMVFLENNVFINTSATYLAAAEEAYYGAQWVFRYNHLTFEENDVHQGGLAGRWAEIYDNTYAVNGVAKSLTNPLPDYWQFRGGSGVVYDNISSQSPCCQDPYPGAQFGPDCPSSDQCTGSWPIPTQVGTGIHETTSSPVYVWGNSASVDGSTQSIQDSLGYTNGTQAGPAPTSCTHPGNVCDVVVTATAPESWVRCESAADLSAGCPVTYIYKPYPYPHPLDDQPASCFGAGCTTQEPDAGSSSDGGASHHDAGSREGSSGDGGTGGSAGDGSGGGGSSPGHASNGCGCVVPPASAETGDIAFVVATGCALLVVSRRRRHGARGS